MSPSAIEHVLVLAEDIERTREFYSEVIGLRVGDRPPLEFPGYWLYAGATPCLHIAERAAYRDHAAGLGLEVDGAPGGRGGIDHIAFSAAGYAEVSARLERAGVRAVRNDVPGAGIRQLFVEDPNGVRIELNVREPNPSEQPE